MGCSRVRSVAAVQLTGLDRPSRIATFAAAVTSGPEAAISGAPGSKILFQLRLADGGNR